MYPVIGLDFGTTNSAIAIATPDGEAMLATFPEDDHHTTTFRSVLYFDSEQREPTGKPRAIGGPGAISAYLQADTRGRLVQSMKSHLASPLFKHTTILGHSYTLEELIALIIRQLKATAEAQFGPIGERVIVGRPAHFSGADDAEADAFALNRLRSAIEQGGFAHVEFELEPVAAAYQYEQQLDHDELVLIADFGGGTSDFCLIQLGPSARKRGRRREDIIGADGVAIAGDTFDSRLVRHLVAPQLGLGSEYRSLFNRLLPVPLWLYEKFERWHHLSFLKTRETLELLRQIRFGAREPEKIDALIQVIAEDLGYHLFRAVERTKCALSAQETSEFTFREALIRIQEQVARSAFTAWIASEVQAIAQCVDRLLAQCGAAPKDVDSVFLTGGSSFVPAVRRIFIERFGKERLRGGEELTTVAKGLALRALAT
ncbi:MAG TPA: Hsp70 family protein [Methylomirabilota bacterium]|nr:Hsp70 family protein [Methylomirabilota bacterium]